MGADVHGFSLDPPTSPSMFDLSNVGSLMHDHRGDIRDTAALGSLIDTVKPEVIFHLAAQSLVRASYAEPLETWSTNVMGTANLLEAVHAADRACAVVVVSSDKCYDNHGSAVGYREDDPLGGADPYSASKAGTELVARTWRDSFFSDDRGIFVASARAGNVIGGGDWATDRIVPDCVRSFVGGDRLELRNPGATRPWQHVLEPVGGYLLLASRLLGHDAERFATAWNFGPRDADVQPVKELVSLFASQWGADAGWYAADGEHPAEAAALSLNCEKAAHDLGWLPTWSLAEAATHTATWYQAWHTAPASLPDVSIAQIASFERAMNAAMS
ncbi:UNVERIFIED_CONTAM: hypothetical protein GTU68_042947 [Idotea baltica]|nr:hypothetical protein [Idotea baltica]